MQFFIPMHPSAATHQAKQLHACRKGGKPHAVLLRISRLAAAAGGAQEKEGL